MKRSGQLLGGEDLKGKTVNLKSGELSGRNDKFG